MPRRDSLLSFSAVCTLLYLLLPSSQICSTFISPEQGLGITPDVPIDYVFSFATWSRVLETIFNTDFNHFVDDSYNDDDEYEDTDDWITSDADIAWAFQAMHTIPVHWFGDMD